MSPVLTNADDVRKIKTTFNKIPIKRQHFTQFNYKTPIRLLLASNMYGAFVNTQQCFNERAKIFDVLHLEPSHKVSMLLPSVSHWWHAPSRLLMTTFIRDKFINDLNDFINDISTTDEFHDALSKFHIRDVVQGFAATRDKILSGTKETNDGLVPMVFNARVVYTHTTPSKINTPISLCDPDDPKSIKPVSWKKLVLNPIYIQSLCVLSMSGFKITRSGLTIDITVDGLCYLPIPEKRPKSLKMTEDARLFNNVQ